MSKCHIVGNLMPRLICYRLMNCCCRQLLDSILGLLLMWFLMQGLRTDYIAHVSLSWGEVSITVCYIFYRTIVLVNRVAKSVKCLTTAACLTADPGVASSILARPPTFVEIHHEKLSMVIFLPSADSFKKGCCQEKCVVR